MLTFCGLTTDGMYEYLAAIYKLSNGDRKVTTSALAETMHVTPAAASSMLKRLDESGFVQRSTAMGIVLCEQGRLAALQLVRRQRLLEVFLVEVMGFTWDQVAAEAHRMEHSISIAFEDRMDELCNFPTHCPHGDPIPCKDGKLPDEDLLPVVQLEPGQQALLRRVGTNDASVLRYLGQLDLVPGSKIKLIDRAPFNGPITLQVENGNHPSNGDQAGQQAETTKILGSELADQLFVLSPGETEFTTGREKSSLQSD